jgi:hypothetical protein
MYINKCNAMQWAALATISLGLQVSGTETVQRVCVLKKSSALLLP